MQFVFFGTDPLAIPVLDALEAAGYLPALIVAGQDRIDSRTEAVIFPPEKQWALARDIPVAQPAKLDSAFIHTLSTTPYTLFIVASYGKILPASLLAIPTHGTLNVHPSLLPRLRGPSPIRSAILNGEREVGVSVMLLDDQMDHGPIIAQKKVPVSESLMRGSKLDELLAQEGAALLAQFLPQWIAGEVDAVPQNHDVATYCKMFTKEDGLLDLSADPHENLRKIRAFEGWPGTYAYFMQGEKRMRVKIIDAHARDDTLQIDTVIPEGKKEMPYAVFLQSGAVPLSLNPPKP